MDVEIAQSSCACGPSGCILDLRQCHTPVPKKTIFSVWPVSGGSRTREKTSCPRAAVTHMCVGAALSCPKTGCKTAQNIAKMCRNERPTCRDAWAQGCASVCGPHAHGTAQLCIPLPPRLGKFWGLALMTARPPAWKIFSPRRLRWAGPAPSGRGCLPLERESPGGFRTALSAPCSEGGCLILRLASKSHGCSGGRSYSSWAGIPPRGAEKPQGGPRTALSAPRSEGECLILRLASEPYGGGPAPTERGYSSWSGKGPGQPYSHPGPVAGILI